jgi:hypothetical protein
VSDLDAALAREAKLREVLRNLLDRGSHGDIPEVQAARAALEATALQLNAAMAQTAKLRNQLEWVARLIHQAHHVGARTWHECHQLTCVSTRAAIAEDLDALLAPSIEPNKQRKDGEHDQ